MADGAAILGPLNQCPLHLGGEFGARPALQLPDVNNDRHVYKDRADMLLIAQAADREDVCALIRIAFYTGSGGADSV